MLHWLVHVYVRVCVLVRARASMCAARLWPEDEGLLGEALSREEALVTEGQRRVPTLGQKQAHTRFAES